MITNKIQWDKTAGGSQSKEKFKPKFTTRKTENGPSIYKRH